MIYSYMHVRMAKIWNSENTKCWWVCGTIGTVTNCWWECQMVSHFGRQVTFYKTAAAAAAAAKWLQLCPTLCSPTDGSPPGSSVPGILQARILEWVVTSFSSARMHAKSLQSWPTLQQPTRLLCPRDSLGKNIGVGCHFLLHLQN